MRESTAGSCYEANSRSGASRSSISNIKSDLGPLAAPRAGLLICGGCAEYAQVIERLPNDLHSRRNARSGETGRNCDNRTLTNQIEWHGHIPSNRRGYPFPIDGETGVV